MLKTSWTMDTSGPQETSGLLGTTRPLTSQGPPKTSGLLGTFRPTKTSRPLKYSGPLETSEPLFFIHPEVKMALCFFFLQKPHVFYLYAKYLKYFKIVNMLSFLCINFLIFKFQMKENMIFQLWKECIWNVLQCNFLPDEDKHQLKLITCFLFIFIYNIYVYLYLYS